MTTAAPGLDGLAGRVGLDARTLGEVVARTGAGYDEWADQVRRAGACSHPIRLQGTITRGGSTVLDTATLPDRVLLKRCGNRRESVCPSCSYEYRGDAWQLLRAGIEGGHKGMPVLAGHPELFITLTAPSYGQLHTVQDARGGLCHPEREGQFCPHGRPRWCRSRHGPGDVRLGQPLCVDCYDYRSHVLFNWWASAELWRRFTVYLFRHLAARLGVTQAHLRTCLRIEAGKVAEYQRRGLIHFHAVIRADAPGPGHHPPRIQLDTNDLEAAVRSAARHVTYQAPYAPGRAVTLRFGKQVHVQAVNSGAPGEITPERVAAYISKYQTKDPAELGLPGRPIHETAARDAGVSDHLCRVIRACHDLARTGHAARLARNAHHGHHGAAAMPRARSRRDPLEDLSRLDRWTHMLGFPGHAFTKSRRFSTTFGTLRRDRADYQRRAAAGHIDDPDHDHDPDDETTPVVNLRYAGRGYTTTGDALLASAIAAWTREGRELAHQAP